MSGHAHDREPGARTVPAWLSLCWQVYDVLTWPLTARQLKREGFRRTGFMTWESGPGNWIDNDPWGDDPWT